MKIKKYLFIFLILLIIISLVNSKQFDYEELKKKSFPKKIKYLIIHFFALIEQYTLYYIMGLRSYNILNLMISFSALFLDVFLEFSFFY